MTRKRKYLILPPCASWAVARSISVSDRDVYVSGQSRFSIAHNHPCFWKNGERTELPMLQDASTYSGNGEEIFISESDDSRRNSFSTARETASRCPTLDHAKGSEARAIYVEE